jgi:hypothetical protein
MLIGCRGWQRRLWDHTICDVDLSEGLDHYAGESLMDDADVMVRWRSSANLSGEYVFTARFTKKDIARLFVEAFSDSTLDDALSMLAAARR